MTHITKGHVLADIMTPEELAQSVSELQAEVDSLKIVAHNYRVAATANAELQLQLLGARAKVERLLGHIENIRSDIKYALGPTRDSKQPTLENAMTEADAALKQRL